MRRTLVAAVLAVLCCGSALGFAPQTDRDPHAWALVATLAPKPTAGNDRQPSPPQFALIHFPPRDGEARSPRGTARIVAWLDTAPQRFAAWGDRVYLVSAPAPSPGGERRRRVQTSAVKLVTASSGGQWIDRPESGFDSLPPLPGDGDLVGFVGSDAGPIAMIRREGEPRWSLLIEAGDRWEPLPLPWETPAGERAVASDDAATQCVLLPAPSGITLLAFGPDAAPGRRYAGGLGNPPRTDSAAGVTWSPPGRVSEPMQRVLLESELVIAGHAAFAVSNRGTSRDVSLVRPSGLLPIRLSSPVRSAASIAAFSGGDTLVITWAEPRPAGEASAGSPPQFHVQEIESASGLVLFDGPAAFGPIITRLEIGLIGVLMVIVTTAVLISILRPAGQTYTRPPAGFRIAMPPRRVLAALADLAVGGAAASWMLGTDVPSIFSPRIWSFPPSDLWPIMAALGVTAAHCTIGEWLFGRSLGKALFACRVISIRRVGPGDGQPSPPEHARLTPALWQALVRNVLRWGAPPVGLLSLSDPLGRHPGDIAAGTAVITPIDPQEESDSPGRNNTGE